MVGSLLPLWGPCAVTGQGEIPPASEPRSPPPQPVKPAHLDRMLWKKEGPLHHRQRKPCVALKTQCSQKQVNKPFLIKNKQNTLELWKKPDTNVCVHFAWFYLREALELASLFWAVRTAVGVGSYYWEETRGNLWGGGIMVGSVSVRAVATNVDICQNETPGSFCDLSYVNLDPSLSSSRQASKGFVRKVWRSWQAFTVSMRLHESHL